MSELRILLVRHGPHELESWRVPDKETELTPEGQRKSQNLARRVKYEGYDIDHCFTSPYRHAFQTAEILVPDIHKIEELNVLTSHNHDQEELFKRIEKITRNGTYTIALVGHEPELHRLVGRMTGKPFDRLHRSEGVLLKGKSPEDFKCGHAELSWPDTEKTYQPEDVDQELREKVRSKMTVAVLLAGFSFAALAELTTGNSLAPLTEDSTFKDVTPWLAVLLLTTASALFIATAYIYDRLSTPRSFWSASKSKRREKLPSYVHGFLNELENRRKSWSKVREFEDENTRPVSLDNEDRRLVYSYMVRTWTHVFTPGVAAGAFGFLLLVMNFASVEFGVLCAVVMLAITLFYVWVRPKLGVD